MITATCTTTGCKWQNVERNVLGEPSRVECGACRADCELTDARDDPPMPDMGVS